MQGGAADASTVLDIEVTAVVLSPQASTATATLQLVGAEGTAAAVPVSVVSAPAGVSVRLLPPSSGVGGQTLSLSVQVSGPAAQGDVWLDVHLNSRTQRVRLPVLRATSAVLPAQFQPAATVPCGPEVLLYAPVTAPLAQRQQLLRLNRGGGSVQRAALDLSASEGVTSLACGAAGDLWLTLRSDDAQGGQIAQVLPGEALRPFRWARQATPSIT